MITKEQLQAMSDFEVNKSLAELLAWRQPNCKNVTFENGCFWVESHGFSAFQIENYCTSPNDIMPLQEKHHICVVGDRDDWCAFLFESEEMEYSDKSLCRAIACCLILVLQEKNNETNN